MIVKKIKSIFYTNELNKIEKIQFILINIIRIILLIAIAGAIYNFRWTILFVSLMTFLLTFLPYFFEKRYKINLPIEFEIVVVLLIYASLFLGEVHAYYTKFWWWDIILHIGSAVALGFIGFIIMYILDKGNKIKANPLTMVIFSFCFALAIGALWEIFEFGMDQLFECNMQKSGLVDTMWDLIVNAIGAFIASVFGFFYLKNGKIFVFDRLMKEFEEENPGFFK